MTNKYSVLSDFEVNKAVAEWLFKDTRYTIISENKKDVKLLFKGQIMDTLTYANSYAYSSAFKLMIDNKLDLDFNPLTNSWSCRKRTNKKYISSLNENPCRSIAECFLLMKDAEKGE